MTAGESGFKSGNVAADDDVAFNDDVGCAIGGQGGGSGGLGGVSCRSGAV
jgi:hypothetical protein